MPRRPLRHSRPLTFSSFARSIAQIASISSVQHPRHESTVQIKKLTPNCAGRGLMIKNMESKNDQIETSNDEEFDGVIQADFAFFDPKPDDFHGVKALLQIYLDDKQWDLTGFVDLILGQTTVGTVVKIEDDEENTIWSVEHKCIMELKEYLLTVCREKDFSTDLRSLLVEEAHNVGLLVSKHNTSLPDKLLPHLYDGLFDEVSWATEDEPTEEHRKSFCFKFYLVSCQIGKLKKTSQKKRQNNEEEILYRNPEDEIFHKSKNYRLMGLVMAVEAERIPTFRSELHSLIDDS
ncbi:BCP1 family [Trema orientale]|uniref:BCP1 family n=1 Tax=Trema orientale TaxID=63057 RepID=A0A2P5EPE7_TREOI|nr:BCP1 family [Trema orientale]